MLMPWRMKAKQHCWSVTDIYFCLVAFFVIDIKVIQYSECLVLHSDGKHYILLYTMIILSWSSKLNTCWSPENLIHVRITAVIVKTCVNPHGWLIADFCVWSQMVSLITTEVHLVFSRLCLDIKKWLCVFLFSERRYYTKDLL